VAAGALAGCGDGTLREAGSSCSQDGDCAAGLSCLGIGNTAGGACTTVARACTKACTTDLDCLAVGSSYRCLPSCTSDGGTCTQVRVQTD
jgi:hypothetical protein